MKKKKREWVACAGRAAGWLTSPVRFFFFFWRRRQANENLVIMMLISPLFLNPLYRYTGPGATANAGHQQEDDRGPESLVRFVGEGTGASGHPQR